MPLHPNSQHQRILVAGTHLRGEGYPNASNTLRILQNDLGWKIVECGYWLPDDFRLWRIAHGSKLSAAATIIGLAFRNAISLISVLTRYRRRDIVYVPYPSLFFLWLASWIPRALRPTCVCDVFVSVWDTLAHDRQLTSKSSTIARLLRMAEARALSAAALIIVDTTANREHLARSLSLDSSKIHAFPLAITEPKTEPAVARSPSHFIEVLFVGTFVPLHGMDVLLKAITPLLNDARFHFTIIGDGQTADAFALELATTGASQLTWIRRWASTAEIERHIAASDICLGVFGGTGKASRVFPFKLYHYLAAGKAIITQAQQSLPDDCPSPPLVGASDDLREQLIDLARNGPRRTALGLAARAYYLDHLSSQCLARRWSHLLERLNTSSR